MFENLIDERSAFLRDLYRYPLAEQDGNAAAKKVVALLLLLHLHDQRRADEGVEVEVLVKNRSSQTNRRINRVLEKNILVVWRGDGIEDVKQRLNKQILEVNGKIQEELLCTGPDRELKVVSFHVFAPLPLIWFFFPLAQVAGLVDKITGDRGLHHFSDKILLQQLLLDKLSGFGFL